MKLVLLAMLFCTRSVAAADGATLATGVVQATQNGSNAANTTPQDQSSDRFATRDVQQCTLADISLDGAPNAQDNKCSTDAAHQLTMGTPKTDEIVVGIDRPGREPFPTCEAARARRQATSHLLFLSALILGVGIIALVLRARRLKINAAVKVQRALRYRNNRRAFRKLRRHKAAVKIQAATRRWLVHNALVIMQAVVTIQFYFWPRSSAGRKAVADAKFEAETRRIEAFYARAKDFFISEGQRLWKARVAADTNKKERKKKRRHGHATYPPAMPTDFDPQAKLHFFDSRETAGLVFLLFPWMSRDALTDSSKDLDLLKYSLLGSINLIETTYQATQYRQFPETWPPGMTILDSAQLSHREERLGSNYLNIISRNISRFLPRLINEASFHITAFARLLNMWLGVMATRIESGEGTLLSPAQAWNSKYDKFPFEFLEFNNAIEADITELFELYYQDIEEENNNPKLTTCSADSSSSDDDEPGDYGLTSEAMELYKHCEAMVRRRSKPQINSCSASCTA